MTKKYFFKHLFILFSLFSLNFFGQNSSEIWKEITNSKFKEATLKHRTSFPNDYKIYSVNLVQLKNVLKNAPKRDVSSRKKGIIVTFPLSNGKLERFMVYESSIMHPLLQEKYPNIKTYAAQGIDDPTATMRFSITQFGLHTMLLSGKHNAEYIDPYTKDGKNIIVYNRNSIEDYRNLVPFECTTEQGYHVANNYNSQSRANTNDKTLRAYHLAQSCTAEYGNIFAGNGTDAQKKANIQAQMTITINRVNEIYERDLAITLQFIPNNDVLIYYGNTNADPWSNEWNNTTQTVIDNAIGNANYDIGHNFNTTGGGNAGCIACVCTTGSKGSGYTGRADPTGDPFDIDYVAHEMGHQFGGYHTMNTCSRSGSGQTEVEPASGSSIMGYAGICPTNVQSNSDAHFNYVNIRDISANIQTGNSTCGAQTALINNPPTANAGSDYTIPANTAFVLEGTANDPDGNASLTYNWSENDPEQATGNGSPQTDWAVGPLYRAKLPITSLKRYLPQFTDVRTGNLTPTWEVTPSVSRTIDFSFIVRDNDIAGGQTASDLMTVTVDANGGPFAVTSQTNAQTWQFGSTQTITWNVANTTNASINTQNVDIYLTDDGETLIPVKLNTPNDGNEQITVPSGLISTTARIMVKGHNNIFYAINSANLTIETNFTLDFANTSNQVCTPNDGVYNFTYNTFNGFSETTVFSASGYPAGATVTFNPSQASANGTNVTMTISGLTNAMVGNYTISVTGTAPSETVSTSVDLTVQSGNFSSTNLLQPNDTAIDVSPSTTLTWTSDVNASSYTIQIASDSAFATVVETATATTNSYVATNLQQGQTYYWRVIYTNNCNSFTTNPFSFTTLTSCSYCASEGNMDFNTSTTLVKFNAINNATGKNNAYEDYTAMSTDVYKGKTHNLTIKVNTDGNFKVVTKVWIDWNQNCDFNDAGEEYDLGNATDVTNGATSNSPLTITIPNTAQLGTTRMRVSSKYTDTNVYPTSCQTSFDGEVEDYTINVKIFNDTCADATALQTGFVFTDYDITTTNVGATASGIPNSGNCGGFGNGEDVWYKVTVPESGNITIETQKDTGSNLDDTVMSVFEGNCSNLTEIACNDDNGNSLFSKINLNNRTPGEELYVRVWEYNNNTFDTFLIAAYDNPCNNPTTIWNGTSWSNGIPDINTPVIIDGNYNNGSFAACEMIINKGAAVTLNTLEYIEVQHNIQNNGIITVLDNASFVQRDNTAKVAGTGNFNTYIKTTPLADSDRFTYFSTPTVNENLSIFNSWANMNAIWDFNNATQHWNLLTGNETMATAKGYAVKPKSTLDFSSPVIATTIFKNKFFNGINTQNLSYNVGQQEPDASDDDSNLVGNPYPSAVDASMLLNNNPSANAFYFWTHNTPITNGTYGDDYAIWNNTGGVAAGSGAPSPSGYIASGQGFFVLANSAGTFTFDNAYRTTTNNNGFIRNENSDAKIWFNLTGNNNEFSQILVAFSNNGTDGFDNHFDAPRISLNSAPISFYSMDTNFNKLGIQTKGELQEQTNIPLGITKLQNNTNTYKIGIDHFENMDNTNIYLKDNLLHLIHDIKINDYTFQLQNNGEVNNRFELIFNRNALSLNEESTENSVIVFSNNSNSFTVKSDNYKIKQLQIFDLLGKIIYSNIPNNNTIVVETSHLSQGTVLLLKITLENGMIQTKKYIVN